MTRSGILLITAALMVVTASLASTAYAICSTCGGGDQYWAASANNFIEGKPINDTPSSLSNPQQNRLRNSDFNSGLLKGASGNPVNSPNNLDATSTFNISLKDINAVPNPVNLGSPVMITISFGNNSSNSQSIPETNMTAYATVKNSAGLEVGKVNLERTSGEEYAGIWNADVTAGAYRATIVASVLGASKTFNDALQIEVSGSKK
jgi:hypothetical protein